MKLRPYQTDCVATVLEKFERAPSTLVVMATGLGKTVILSEVANRWKNGRVLVIAHRDELIRQAAEKLESALGVAPEIDMAEEYASVTGTAPIVSSVQTMCRSRRHGRFDPKTIGLIVIDEAHHAVAKSYRDVVKYYREGNADLKVLGVTATPRRSDALALGQVFETVAYEYGIDRAVEDGWLCPVRQRIVEVENLDFSKVRTIAGDFNQAELEEILANETVLHAMAAPIVKEAGASSTLVFCVGVKQSELIAAVLDRYKRGSAQWVSGETPKDERRRIVADYKEGRTQFLVNCGVFLEGFDAPETQLVAMCRPTQSIVVYTQCLGRVTRTLPGVVDHPDCQENLQERKRRIAASGKPSGMVLDFVGNVDKHNAKVITAADVLGGKWNAEVRQYARKSLQEEGQARDLDDALELADAELALLAEEAERRRKIVAKVEYGTREVGLGDCAVTSSTATPDVHRGDQASQGQVWFLVNRGGWEPHKAQALSKKQAGAIIGKIKSGQMAKAG